VGITTSVGATLFPAFGVGIKNLDTVKKAPTRPGGRALPGGSSSLVSGLW
jgi:hypothetical protein